MLHIQNDRALFVFHIIISHFWSPFADISPWLLIFHPIMITSEIRSIILPHFDIETRLKCRQLNSSWNDSIDNYKWSVSENFIVHVSKSDLKTSPFQLSKNLHPHHRFQEDQLADNWRNLSINGDLGNLDDILRILALINPKMLKMTGL